MLHAYGIATTTICLREESIGFSYHLHNTLFIIKKKFALRWILYVAQCVLKLVKITCIFLHFPAVGNYQDALKYYLQAASVSSNHFMQPIPYQVFDAEVRLYCELTIFKRLKTII